MQESRIAQAISERGVAAGAMRFEFDTPGVMRILAAAGVDFAIFDLEHTAWDAGTLRTLFAAGRSTGVHTITRVIRAQYPLIASALDAGSACCSATSWPTARRPTPSAPTATPS